MTAIEDEPIEHELIGHQVTVVLARAGQLGHVSTTLDGSDIQGEPELLTEDLTAEGILVAVYPDNLVIIRPRKSQLDTWAGPVLEIRPTPPAASELRGGKG